MPILENVKNFDDLDGEYVGNFELSDLGPTVNVCSYEKLLGKGTVIDFMDRTFILLDDTLFKPMAIKKVEGEHYVLAQLGCKLPTTPKVSEVNSVDEFVNLLATTVVDLFKRGILTDDIDLGKVISDGINNDPEFIKLVEETEAALESNDTEIK